MSLLKALFLPIMPPKKYSFEDRNFESEYEEMKRQYIKSERQKDSGGVASGAKFDVPLSWRMR